MYFTLIRDDGIQTDPVAWTNTYVDYRTDAVMGNDVTFFGLTKGRYTHYRIYIRDMSGTPRPHQFELPTPVDVRGGGTVTLDSLQVHIGRP